MSARNEARRRRRVLRLLRTALVCLIALAVALLFSIVPYRSFLSAAQIAARGEGEVRLHFLSVGQGDCTIVEFPGGDVLVVDAGDGSFEANNAIVSYVKGLNVRSLSLLATHADIDHYGGFSELLRVFQADKFYLPVLSSPTSAYQGLLAAIAREGCETQTLTRYDVIGDASGAYVVCISPHGVDETDSNAASTMLYMSYAGVNILLSADADAAREKSILSELQLAEDILDSGIYRVRPDETHILKVAHHGAAGSSDADWLAFLSPEAAIVSCGAGNGYHHPAGEAMARLAGLGTQIYRTDELGNIMLTVRGGSYTITYA